MSYVAPAMPVASRPGFEAYTFPDGRNDTSGRGLSRYQNCRTGGFPEASVSQRERERSFSRSSPR